MRLKLPLLVFLFIISSFSIAMFAIGCTAAQANKAQGVLTTTESATQAVVDTVSSVSATPGASMLTQILVLLLAGEKLLGAYVIPMLTKKDSTLASSSPANPPAPKA